MSDQKKYTENYYYDNYSRLYTERELSIDEERNRLERLMKLDTGIVDDSINDFELWVKEESNFSEDQRSTLLDSILKHKENRLHVISPEQFIFKLKSQFFNVVIDSFGNNVGRQSNFSEPLRLIELISDKGTRISKMEKQKRALNKIDNDIQNNELRKMREIEVLIEKFADDFASRPNSDRPKEEIIAYLNIWVNKTGNHGKRSNAKREAIKVCPSLESASPNTLKNWEIEWGFFLNSRTEN